MFFWPTTGDPLTSRSGAFMHREPRMLTFSNWQKLMGRNSSRSTLASQALFSFPHWPQEADDRPNSCCRTFQTTRNMLAIHSPEHFKKGGKTHDANGSLPEQSDHLGCCAPGSRRYSRRFACKRGPAIRPG